MTDKPIVRCDEYGCGWEQELEENKDILKWTNVPCPKCGKGVIVNDEESALMEMILAVQSFLPKGSGDEKSIEIHIDTKGMR